MGIAPGRKAGERRCSKCRHYTKHTWRYRGFVLCEGCMRKVDPRRLGQKVSRMPHFSSLEDLARLVHR